MRFRKTISFLVAGAALASLALCASAQSIIPPVSMEDSHSSAPNLLTGQELRGDSGSAFSDPQTLPTLDDAQRGAVNLQSVPIVPEPSGLVTLGAGLIVTGITLRRLRR